ncbi:hypothetical protein [Vulcanisaeta sp. JCM 16159]|uniref:hypothetical protein n=1 Tax=Vulcanisaeta sp. JCM 16159 TaxID=1295371 RepID=UPI000ABE9A6E|nr:hypothetical protein [Vulcanisaeta sp. JCM 16159]
MTAYVTSPMITLMYEKNGEMEFTGISLVKRPEFMHEVIPWVSLIIPWTTELLNVNTQEDLKLAFRLCKHE